MKVPKWRRLLATLAGLTASLAMSAACGPLVGRGSAGSLAAPPAPDARETADISGELRPIPTLEPTDEPPPAPTPFPTATPNDPLWEDRTPGIERREVIVTEPNTATPVRLHMVRVDPSLMDFRVEYVPRRANSVSGWQVETGAFVIVNGGFFDGEFFTDGVTIVDGQQYGVSPDREDRIGIGGLFMIQDGAVSIVPLNRRGDLPDLRAVDYATQSYPMLLMPGSVPAFNEETGQAAERTVVAMDPEGRVIFIVVRTAIFTLYQLSRTLADLDETHDIALDLALNLDGGKSSGMEVWAGPEHTHWNSVSSLPIVIAVYPKEGVPVVPQAPIPPRLE